MPCSFQVSTSLDFAARPGTGVSWPIPRPPPPPPPGQSLYRFIVIYDTDYCFMFGACHITSGSLAALIERPAHACVSAASVTSTPCGTFYGCKSTWGSTVGFHRGDRDVMWAQHRGNWASCPGHMPGRGQVLALSWIMF